MALRVLGDRCLAIDGQVKDDDWHRMHAGTDRGAPPLAPRWAGCRPSLSAAMQDERLRHAALLDLRRRLGNRRLGELDTRVVRMPVQHRR